VSVNAPAKLRELLAERSGTQPEEWFLVHKARFGMEVVFTSLRNSSGPGNVITQIFTCATAVNPILAAGLTPRYAEVSVDSLSLDSRLIAIEPADKGVVIQNTFGMISDDSARDIAIAARTAGLLVMEDSAHAVGRLARDESGAPVADVSIHSFGVEKLLSTKFGGAIWLNPKTNDEGYPQELRAGIAAALHNLVAPSARQRFAARTYRTQLRVLTRLPRAVSSRLRRLLVSAGLFDPPIAPRESLGVQAAPVGMSTWVASQAVQSLAAVAAVESQRSQAVAVYARGLRDSVHVPAHVASLVAEGMPEPLVRFPFYVESHERAEALIAVLTARGIPAGRWYRPALFPGAQDPAIYHYVQGSAELAVSEDAIMRVVNLPTNVTVERAQDIVALVKEHLGR